MNKKLVYPISLLMIAISRCSLLSMFDYVIKEDKLSVERMLLDNPKIVLEKDKLGKEPLHYAVCGRSRELLELLYLFGADLNAQDLTGMTPLHVCAMWDRKGACKWLLEKGANPMLKDIYGDTPLHTSAIFGSVGVGAMLLKQGLSLEDKNNNGKTPIDLAREHNNLEWLIKVAKIGER
ncbi:MAG: ankyrin repeat domain-containing protein [Candidatus Hydrogenedentes bacterium]|nr:ankyrin repeat domain-containing protein [Candidatus Hydrogenedentota bacterium]